jgi:hypothetical protein
MCANHCCRYRARRLAARKNERLASLFDPLWMAGLFISTVAALPQL